jgi:hypothetical protein
MYTEEVHKAGCFADRRLLGYFPYKDGCVKKLVVIFLAAISAVFLCTCITIDPKKMYPDMVADMDPITVGTIEAEFDRVFSNRLNKLEVEVVFYPRYNMVALNFQYQLTNYRQFWPQEGRELFIKAVESYKADFAARNLGRKFSKTRRAYGKFKGKLEWTFTKLSEVNVSFPVMELGYRFRGDQGKETPFFTVSQYSAKEESSQGDSNKPDSVPLYIYFIIAQADSLAKVFDQNNLLNFVEAETYNEPKDDDYGEAVF